MKKLILFSSISLFTLWLYANPVYMPGVFLDSLSFDSEKHWKIALFVNQPPDSIMISSSSGRSFYKSLVEYNWTLTEDSLSSELFINPDGDSVTIVSFSMNWESSPDSMVEIIVFGDYRGAAIPKPLEGQSIVRIFPDIEGTDYHCLRGSSGSVTGTLHGKIYDKENDPVKAGSFCLSPFPVNLACPEGGYGTDGFSVQGNGTYSIGIYTLLYTIGTIQVCSFDQTEYCRIYWTTGSIQMDTLHFIMLPDSSMEMDIHLREDLSGIREEKKYQDPILKIFPNPAIHGCLHYEMGIPVKSAKCLFVLFDSGGRKVWSQPVQGNSGVIELPSGIPDGFYFLQVRMNERSLASAPIVVER